MNMFNDRGELNASSLKDAASQLMKYASILQENMPSNTGLAGQPSMSDQVRDDLVSKAILTQDGKIALSQAMANPIK
jgi:hypothetical protein